MRSEKKVCKISLMKNSNLAYVIIVNWNGKKYLKNCLESVSKQSYLNYRIVLVDNNSTDASLKFVENNFPQIKVIRNNKNLGFAKGNNVGIKYALKQGADYIILLNNDTMVDKKWIEELVNSANRDDKIGIVQSKIYLFGQKNIINTLGNEVHFLGFAFCGNYKSEDTGQFNKDREITCASGAGCLIKREIVEKIEMFNEDFFMYHEDSDLGWRTRMAGYKIILSAKSKMWHKYSFSRNRLKYYYLERNRLSIVLQNYQLKSLFFIFPAFLFMEIGILGFSLINGWFVDKIRSYFDILKNLRKIFLKRRRIQKIRVMDDKDIVNLFVGQITFEEIDNPVLRYFANPLLNFYWKLIKNFI